MDKKMQKKLRAAGVILLCGNLLLFLTIWLVEKYDHVYLEQVLFQMKTSSEGVYSSLASSAIVRVVLFGVVLTAAEVLLYWLLSGRCSNAFRNDRRYLSYRSTKVCRFFTYHALSLALAVLVSLLHCLQPD